MSRRDVVSRFLEGGKLRNTAGRRAILREIAGTSRGYFSAEDLMERFRGRGVSVSRATVYRTLDQLVRSDLLARLSLGKKHAVYERRSGNRNPVHFCCVRCGRSAEVCSPALERILARLCRRKGFTPERRGVQFLGVCDGCARLPGARGRKR